jgi:hypothetical protein
MTKPHSNVVSLPRKTYEAKSFVVRNCGVEIRMSGTLDGYIDLCFVESNGRHVTYTLDPGGMRLIANAALGVADDVTKNCLYEADTLLLK